MTERERPITNPWTFAAHIGFFAGLIWGVLKVVEHALRFTYIVPGFLLEPFYRHDYLGTWSGYLIGLLSFIAFSVVAALVYAVFFLKAYGPWPGLLYGVGWWALLYLIVGPAGGLVPPIGSIDWRSLITDFCLFVLWGLFIGYSISVEFTDESERDTASFPLRTEDS